MTAPRATVRLQLNRGFGLADAARQVRYYAALGISHLYLSPIAQARPGSTHGYDVIDPQVISEDLGGEPAWRALEAELRNHGMGAILDIVPNHMAADVANPWWRDVLAHGRGSRFADWFDIDWDAPGVEGKLWLPWLEAPLEHVLRKGGLRLARQADDGIGLFASGANLPVSDASLRLLHEPAGTEDTPAAIDRAMARVHDDPALLRRFLDLQHYRLAWWRSGNEVGNYRRFFDIGGLVALDMQRDDVFEAVHRLPLRLVAEGVVDGLRVDHVDGLARPTAYLRKLRSCLDRAVREGSRPQRHALLYVEKILAPDETLRDAWPVDGSTGYDFMQAANAVLHDPAGREPLESAWRAFADRHETFSAEEQHARQELLGTALACDLARCTRAFQAAIADTPEQGDLTAPALREALREVLEQMPAYRSYLGDDGPDEADRAVLEEAFARADMHGAPDRADARLLLRRRLLDTLPRGLAPGPRRRLLEARQRFEQLAAALNAKAVEDTAFYRFGLLLSRNEVGSDPRRFALSVDSFHHAMHRRGASLTHTLSATATHDHKRGEDTRARLAVLSERADWFASRARAWRDRLGADRPAGNAVWMLLQTLLAAWPLGMQPDDAPAVRAFAERLAAWLLKAEREAKLHTRWTSPDTAYERNGRRAVERLLLADRGLCAALAEAAASLDAPGALNGLASVTLRLTAPGVPDLYQGTEYWDQSLVDPDNRVPVDYARRRRSLEAESGLAELMTGFRDGAIKQHLIRTLLQLRRSVPSLFAQGGYVPLQPAGERAAHLLAYERRRGPYRLLVAVPRWYAQPVQPDRPAVWPEYWESTRLLHVPQQESCTWVDVFTRQDYQPCADGLPVGRLFARWPVAVLTSTSVAYEYDQLAD